MADKIFTIKIPSYKSSEKDKLIPLPGWYDHIKKGYVVQTRKNLKKIINERGIF